MCKSKVYVKLKPSKILLKKNVQNECVNQSVNIFNIIKKLEEQITKKSDDVINNVTQQKHRKIKCYTSTFTYYYIDLFTNFFKKCPTPCAVQDITCNL